MRLPTQSDGFSIREFLQTQVLGSVLLLTATAIALVWANSPWHGTYDNLLNTSLTLGTVHLNLTGNLHFWVNDGLMAIFFLVVGLEIKRELQVGELSSISQAALPVVAAAGGVLVPAGIYFVLNHGRAGSAGWGIPMATDIAFALGVLALLGSRIPLALKIFLSALAIVDDLVAVLVIGIAYTDELNISALGAAAVIFAILVGANRLGVRQAVVYGLLGIALWIAVFQSGIHATVAGVLLAVTIPSQTRIDRKRFVRDARSRVDQFARANVDGPGILTSGEQQEALAELEDLVEAVGAPSQRLEQALHPWVSYAIVPLFALANAGIRMEGSFSDTVSSRITLGVVLGLVLGKMLGIMGASWLTIRLGITSLPRDVSWRLLLGMSWLGGIGFTMSIFISDLAFDDHLEGALQTDAKVGILIASLISGLIGYTLLSRWTGQAAHTANPD